MASEPLFDLSTRQKRHDFLERRPIARSAKLSELCIYLRAELALENAVRTPEIRRVFANGERFGSPIAFRECTQRSKCCSVRRKGDEVARPVVCHRTQWIGFDCGDHFLCSLDD